MEDYLISLCLIIINDQDLQELNQYFYEVYGAKISE
ncbi:hypothetical protein NIVACYA_02456 [Planktothrix agardhii]|jgi:hypothetical protein|nr:hypothetical protein NIES204_34970 [Planktothrix agardhii NIES-204]CAD5942383.1 hypothetical protein NIVACYA_02456 [Planktothrix agardhii]